MKKTLFILLASIFLVVACNGDDTENNNGGNNENDQTEENDKSNNEEGADGQQDVYQIGETAASESSSYGFPYEVTVNDFKVTADEVDGHALADFYSETSEPSEDSRFAVINITMANTGDDFFVVNDTMTPVLSGEITSEYSEVDVMPAFDEEISPGEEITADLIFITDTLFEEDGMVDLYFNIHDPKLEFKFELPIP